LAGLLIKINEGIICIFGQDMVLSRHKQITEALSHPMLLLIVGAIISSLIIPYFTRQWQDHQHELELKNI
jgi:hypothetical protein